MHQVSAALAVLLLAFLVPAVRPKLTSAASQRTAMHQRVASARFWERNGGALHNASGQLVSYRYDPTTRTGTPKKSSTAATISITRSPVGAILS